MIVGKDFQLKLGSSGKCGCLRPPAKEFHVDLNQYHQYHHYITAMHLFNCRKDRETFDISYLPNYKILQSFQQHI